MPRNFRDAGFVCFVQLALSSCSQGLTTDTDKLSRVGNVSPQPFGEFSP